MKRSKPLQTGTSFRQRIILALFGLSLFFVFLEAGLRLAGFISRSLQEYRNTLSVRQKGAYRIMCLGESTTAGQYPSILEEVLNQRNIGIRFSVIDEGGVGANTELILKQAESYLNEYHPDMVVVMMGINDAGAHIPYEQPSLSATIRFLRSFKIYKLSRLIWLHMATKAKETRLYKLRGDKQPAQGRQSKVGFEGGHTRQEGNIKDEDALKKAPGLNPVNDWAYVELGRIYFDTWQLQQAEECFKKAMKLNPVNDWAYLELGQLYEGQGQLQQAEECFKKALKLNPANDWAYIGLGRLYYGRGELQQAEECFKKALEFNPGSDLAYGSLAVLYQGKGMIQSAQEHYKKTDELRLAVYNPITTYNYHKFKEILDQRGVKLVCVQYPMRSIAPLRLIFEQQAGIIFVDNEKSFKEAVAKEGYGEYFRDLFGGDFGHCTPKGNRLLAENIAKVILKEVFNK